MMFVRRFPVTIFMSLFMMLDVLLASSGSHQGDEGIPTKFILVQALNLAIFVGFLLYMIRKPIRSYFKERSSSFYQAAQRAEVAIQNAETEKKKIAEQLSHLQNSADSSITQAKAEAEELKRQIIQEAETLMQTLRQEAERTVKYEIEKSRAVIRDELLKEAMTFAQSKLDGKMAELDQRRLQSEFVEKIQVVNR